MASPLLTTGDPERVWAGPPPTQLLRTLDLTVRRKMDGLLAGDHRSSRLGLGTELAQVRPYEPGDDVRAIDWNATARTSQPHVRVHVAERALTTWLVLDTSASMAFGTADRRKADVAEGVALAVGYAATKGVNRLGVATYGGAVHHHRPPAQGRAGLLGLVHALGDEIHADGHTPTEGDKGPRAAAAGPTSLGAACDAVARLARTRSLVVVVGDLRGPRDWRSALLRLCARHEVVVAEVRDQREQELPNVGELTLVDPETGRQLRVDTRSAKLRHRFAAAAAAERAEVARSLAGAGAAHVVLPTGGDWLGPLAAFLHLREHRRS